ncbi:NAD(P)/FAD-dependent oxidoreductase [Algiphilus sp. W345]|uniref:NAD(P)/FAD-dependent oxidoreductase n=1 Tax=Banduia mediterranea TaxID=3075609 RepID=A0ABU2WED0_9GAMM|nr:NAD(P)/FAD-dependent oxidoreductase [Algiphilus sp. W345]MDT0496217.1 NAD(P)/FAD-dependent oxidoreductase [Algiphilus sp. W345]
MADDVATTQRKAALLSAGTDFPVPDSGCAARPVPHRPDHEVIIVGAGISGIGLAIELKKAGIESFVILERAGDVGGTWRDNRYPGIAVDITSFTYSFSFEQNPDWSRVFAPGAELQRYAQRVAAKYGVYPKARFRTEVDKAVFLEDRDLWEVRLKNGECLYSRFLVGASGGLISPKKPEIKGLDSFKGTVMHTGYWDDSVDLNGRRVAVIGTGATAVQLVPSIASKVAQLDVYQRTPIWVLKKPDAEIPAWLKSAFRILPLVQRGVRACTDALTETVMVGAVIYFRQIPGLVRGAEQACKNNLLEQIPNDPELREKLTPKYGFGCKRPTFSNDYFKSFTRHNVELVTDPIDCITETGIRTRDGRERPIDVLITATGYRVFEKGNMPAFEVWGRDGVELGQFWDEHRYQAYEAVSVPKFPNYFGMLGPYGLTGTSYFKMVEAHAIHAVRCIKEARRRGKTRVEIGQGPHERYFQDVMRRQQNTVFVSSSCASSNSYYFDKHGDAPMLRPTTTVEMLWRAKHFPMEHYRFSCAEARVAAAQEAA